MDSQACPVTNEPEISPDDELLLGLIFGALQDEDPVSSVEFAVKLAVCARITQGDADAYARAVKKTIAGEQRLVDIFPRAEIEKAARMFMRAIRGVRNDGARLKELGEQFEHPQDEPTMRTYMIEAERLLSKTFMTGR